MAIRSHNHRRFALLDDGRAAETCAGCQTIAIIDRRIHIAAQFREIGPAAALANLCSVRLRLLPGAQATQFAVLLRLARLARLVMVTKGARRLFERLGRVAGLAVGVVVIGSLVAYNAEHPANPGFATIGDALWWGIVTLTTVGYGDIVPKTATGRWAAVIIMITGIAVLGVLAGSLASFFRLDNGTPSNGSPAADEPTSSVDGSSDAALQSLAGEVSALRHQVEALTARLTGTSHGPAPQEPTTDEDPPS